MPPPTSPPYPGQGLAVPYEGEIDGEWVFQNQVFVFRQPIGQPVLAKIFSNGEGGVGFHIEPMARFFRKTPEEIWDFNHAKTLWVRWENAPPGHGADITEIFIFTTPDGFNLTIPVNSAAIRGNA